MAPADAHEWDEAEEPARDEAPDAEICATEGRPGRTVFCESGNPEAWIGTDLTVEVER